MSQKYFFDPDVDGGINVLVPVQWLLRAMRRYDYLRNKDCMLRDGLVPENQLEVITRIHRWSGEIIKRQEKKRKCEV